MYPAQLKRLVADIARLTSVPLRLKGLPPLRRAQQEGNRLAKNRYLSFFFKAQDRAATDLP
jgi:hypothetical protein